MKTRLWLTLILLLITANPSTALSDDARQNARHLVTCMLRLVHDIYPYMMIALMVYGEVMYLTAAENQQQRIMGRKYVIFALIGAACVQALFALAQYPPFSLPDPTTYRCTPIAGFTTVSP